MLCWEDGCCSFLLLWVVKMPNWCLIICLHPFAFDYWLLFKLQRWAELWVFLHKRITWGFSYVCLEFFCLLNMKSMALSSSGKYITLLAGVGFIFYWIPISAFYQGNLKSSLERRTCLRARKARKFNYPRFFFQEKLRCVHTFFGIFRSIWNFNYITSHVDDSDFSSWIFVHHVTFIFLSKVTFLF